MKTMEQKTQRQKEQDLDVKFFSHLKREMAWTVGEWRAAGILLRFGASLGRKEAREKTEEWPSHRLNKNIVKTNDNRLEEYLYETANSPEVTAFSALFPTPSKQAECFFLAGYLSGWLSVKKCAPIAVLETHCRAKGDTCCRFVGRPLNEWDEQSKERAVLYREDNMAEELADTREQLRLTRDRYQTLFEQSSVPILISDPHSGVFVDANIVAERLTGYSRQELSNMTMFDLCPPHDHHLIVDDIKDLSAGEAGRDIEITLIRSDAMERVVMTSSKLLNFGDEPVLQRTLRDVTDLKIVEQKERDLQHQLQRSERLSSIGQLAASVAHELKNPLGAIRNAVYYIRKALDNTSICETDPHLKEILKLSEQEVDGAVTIIEELLDYSQVVHLSFKKTSVNEMLETLPHAINFPDNIQLAWDLDVTLPSIDADPNRLRQVFANIVTNALQSMPNGGTLTVSTRLDVTSGADGGPDLQTVAIGFEDTGGGIDAAHLKKIFEPLYTTKVRGTGLGLAICSNIMEKHGGRIDVVSKVGKGTKFTVHLPLQAPIPKEEPSHDVK